MLSALMAGALFPLAGYPQPVVRTYRIGMLFVTNRALTESSGNLPPFIQTLSERGYAEGRNLLIEWRGAEGRVERLSALAAELASLNVDVIVAGAESAAVAAKNATKTIPVVFVAAADPVGLGLVKSLSRPGGNVTGFSSDTGTLVPKRLELLREMYPGITRLAVLHQPGDSSSTRQLASISASAGGLRLKITTHEMKAPTDVEGALRQIEKERPEGMMVFASPLTFIHRKRICEFAAAQGIPAVYGFASYVEAGGLMSYGFSFPDNYRRSAEYVDKILKGAKPSDLPVQEPVKFDLTVNLKAAKALGAKIPQSLLVRADRVIE